MTREAGTPPRDDPPAESGPPGTAAGLVASLWRTAPPSMWAPERGAAAPAVELSAVIARLAADAERLLREAEAEERPAVALLAETARAVCTALGTQPPTPDRAGGEGTALPSSARLRLARMEQWLAARAAADPCAEPSANLCLWVLDQSEGGPT
ncbi:hypothetical protein tb265_42630 [Gemmatimonadetes bacterium T265]|nr:hypothetical protein tb265_42630 [Gemmatimonadetes bacterium T265]